MAAEAAFKDVPEIFEASAHRDLIGPHPLTQVLPQVELGEAVIARTEALGTPSPENPKSVLFPQSISLKPLSQPRFVNSGRQTFAMSSRVQDVPASAT